jgi:hypothetical protein
MLEKYSGVNLYRDETTSEDSITIDLGKRNRFRAWIGLNCLGARTNY